jgi:hypothetical protein
MPKRGTIMEAAYVWKELYETALLETDDLKLPNRFQAAKATIEARLLELQGDHGTPEEKQAISDALHGLDVLREELERHSHDTGPHDETQ